ncbi:MAG: phage tail family protein [Coriobacteriia bacterium]|nr:phage tail family protein [Coriobacteriia bacterium]
MAREAIVKIVRDDGKEFLIDGNEYFLTPDGLVGVDFADWSIYTEPLAFKDGSVVTGASFTGRPITLTFFDRKTEDMSREVVRKFFNARGLYVIYVTLNGITRWITGVIQTFAEPTDTNGKYTKCTVGIFCEDPFFNSMEEEWNDLQKIKPMFGFPYISTEEHPSVMSVYVFGEYVRFENNGDVDTSFAVFLYFTGNVTNPVIYQGYREHKFQLNGTFTEDDIVFIDFDTATVYKNGVSCWNLVDKDSELLEVPRGGTYLSSTAEEGEELLHCVVNYSEKYAGV